MGFSPAHPESIPFVGCTRDTLFGCRYFHRLYVFAQLSAFNPVFGLFFQILPALQFDLTQTSKFGLALTFQFPFSLLLFSFDSSGPSKIGDFNHIADKLVKLVFHPLFFAVRPPALETMSPITVNFECQTTRWVVVIFLNKCVRPAFKLFIILLGQQMVGSSGRFT